ncbi:type 2 phosphatidylinositol 4,5-bisphosphate 4-phosphatase-like isoform X2 [Physella acuta]|nr:type 2 phosphatidylinositol 4,5-bisphosphate 4-phosphatase-like isoform X2 [Physella acuta]
MADSERTPLLQNESNIPEPPPYLQQGQSNEAATLPVGTDELPPPYTPTAQGGIPMINCKVCQAIISLEGKQHQFVVKCSVCNEATPIRAPPPGKKYIRCPCNLLLVCRSGASKILCPRETCKRVITLPSPSDPIHQVVTTRYTCAYCSQVFVLRIIRKFARCPHCRRLSAAGYNYAKSRAIFFLCLGLLFIGVAVGITIGTYEYAHLHGGIYVSWIGGFLLGLLCILRSVYYFLLRTSPLLQ